MPRFEHTIDISAPPERVWAVMRDVDRWHEWTASISGITRVDDARFEPGARVVIRQPGFPAARWTVTTLDPARGFTWVSTSPGMVVTGNHWIEPIPGGSRVTLSLEMRGALSGLFGTLTGAKTRRYIAMEAQGLKRESEAVGEGPTTS